MLDTIIDTVTNPFGTARLVEGFCALNRAAKAGLTMDQMRAVYTDLEHRSDEEISGFIHIGQDLISGATRFRETAFPTQSDMPPMPEPA